MPQDKDELLQVLITKYAQMYMKLAYATILEKRSEASSRMRTKM